MTNEELLRKYGVSVPGQGKAPEQKKWTERVEEARANTPGWVPKPQTSGKQESAYTFSGTAKVWEERAKPEHKEAAQILAKFQAGQGQQPNASVDPNQDKQNAQILNKYAAKATPAAAKTPQV